MGGLGGDKRNERTGASNRACEARLQSASDASDAADATRTGQDHSVVAQRVVTISSASDRHSHGRVGSCVSGSQDLSVTNVWSGPCPEPWAAPQDLSSTALEWGGQQGGALGATHDRVDPLSESGDAQWATHSSISLQLDEPETLRRLASLDSLDIEDAETLQIQPTASAPARTGAALPGQSAFELAELDEALSHALSAVGRGAARFGSITDVRGTGRLSRAQAVPTRTSVRPVRLRLPNTLPSVALWAAVAALASLVLMAAYCATSLLVCEEPARFGLMHLRCVTADDALTAGQLSGDATHARAGTQAGAVSPR